MTESLPPAALAQVLDGKRVASELRAEVGARVAARVAAGERAPALAILLVGGDPASQVYVRSKSRACREVGVRYFDLSLPEETTPEQLLERLQALNADPSVDGILLQLPLPPALRAREPEFLAAIAPEKDVDGFHPSNVGLLHLGMPRFVPCTAAGILTLLQRTGTTLRGKHAVVLGRSNLVGKPVAALLTQRDLTVTLCHSRTLAPDALAREADILVAAVGRRELVRGDWIKPGAVVIDVGIHRLDDGTLVGDVAYLEARSRASWITPVPGGVGPMTIAELLRNVLRAAELPKG